MVDLKIPALDLGGRYEIVEDEALKLALSPPWMDDTIRMRLPLALGIVLQGDGHSVAQTVEIADIRPISGRSGEYRGRIEGIDVILSLNDQTIMFPSDQ